MTAKNYAHEKPTAFLLHVVNILQHRLQGSDAGKTWCC